VCAPSTIRPNLSTSFYFTRLSSVVSCRDQAGECSRCYCLGAYQILTLALALTLTGLSAL
jgi:hypothetical protein